MTLGLFLILIVIVPYCIYLYIKNKELIIKIKELEKNNKEILTRKILKNNDQDTLPLTSLSSKQLQNNKKEISKDNRKKEETNINQINNQQNIKENNRGEYLKEVVKKLNEQQTNKPVELTKYEQEQENNAIISYQELKKEDSNNKFIVKEEDEVVDFLNHLKEFRNNLK